MNEQTRHKVSKKRTKMQQIEWKILLMTSFRDSLHKLLAEELEAFLHKNFKPSSSMKETF
jgi:hypothetical protein